jgi:serine/threonine-protein kinase RsbW
MAGCSGRLRDITENRHELTVVAAKEQIPIISDFIADLMTASGFGLQKMLEVQLAAEEACTNIALYAYPEKKGCIHIAADLEEDRLKLAIADEGIPFDPTTRNMTISSADVEHRPIGGLGIALIRALVDGMSYEFSEGRNVFRLVKNKM